MQLSFYTYYISHIEIGLLWAKIKCLKIAQKPWTLASKQIWSISFKWGTKHWFWSGGCKDIRGQSWRLKKYLPTWPTSGAWVWIGLIGRYHFWPPTLTSDIFAASCPKSMFSSSFERNKSPVWRLKSKAFEWLLRYVIFAQSKPIYVVFI